MFCQALAQWRWSALIKKNAQSRHFQRLRGVFENHPNLLGGNAWKPLHEIRDLRPVFKILKQCSHRNARATEHPGATDTLRMPLNRGTSAPVAHHLMLRLSGSAFKCT